MSFLGKLFSGGGVVKSIENIASEWIETDMESAEAKVLMVKTLDPNGKMRRDLSKDVSQIYKLYLVVSLLLLTCEFFGLGDSTVMAVATSKLTDLFMPITTLFGVIVSASFGVNALNVKQGK